MSDNNGTDERNVLLYMLAGIGLGALIGAAAGVLFAPKPGTETRENLSKQISELRAKLSDWYAERKAKMGRAADKAGEALEEATS